MVLALSQNQFRGLSTSTGLEKSLCMVRLGRMYNKKIQLNICTANPTLGYTFTFLWVGSASI